MFVGVLTLDMHIPGSDSLKMKRLVLKSLVTRLRNKFNVSVAEVDQNEKWQRAVVAIALVSNEQGFIDQVFTQILNLCDKDHDYEIIAQQREIL